MKKLHLILFLFAIVFCITSNTYSQPKLTLNVTGGYTLAMQDFSSTIVSSDTADDNWPYKNKSGFNFGLDGKLAIGKKGNFRVVFGGTYNMFKQTGSIVNPDDGSTISLTTKMNILAIALGGEWAFQPTKKVNPFLGLDFTVNFFSGSFATVPSVVAFQRTNMKSETRIGIQFGGGIDFKLSKQVGAIVGVKYHLVNLIGVGADDSTQVAANEIDLGDKAHTEGGVSVAARSIGYLQAYVGVSFYFGEPKKTTMKK